MKFNGIKLTYARLHDLAHIPAIGAIGPSLSGVSNPKDKSYDLTLVGDQGQFVQVKTTHNGTNYKLLMPAAAFEVLRLEDEA